jgi:hypothetical protein
MANPTSPIDLGLIANDSWLDASSCPGAATVLRVTQNGFDPNFVGTRIELPARAPWPATPFR